MTWDHCELVERVPGKMAGRPVIKGTRIEPDTLVTDYELGSPIEEIHENFPTVSVETIEKVLAFAHRHQPVQSTFFSTNVFYRSCGTSLVEKR